MSEKSLRDFYDNHAGKVSDKWRLYIEEYDRLLKPYCDKAINLLEIGIQNGGSLEIWSQFFPKAKLILGCDINPACEKLSYVDPRIRYIVGDANQLETVTQVAQLAEKFDVIIDDGSHTSGDIIKSFFHYFKMLSYQGLFIAEDLHCSYWQSFDGGLFKPASSIAFFKRLADVINHEHWGIPIERKQIIKLFTDKYGLEVSEELLSEIHSIEFINSICVVRKAHANFNQLNGRVFVGQTAVVVPEVLQLIPTLQNSNIVAHEVGNPWSAINLLEVSESNIVSQLSKDLTDKESQILTIKTTNQKLTLENQKLDKKVRDLELHFQELVSSTSWQITAPLRYAGKIQNRLLRLLRLVPVALQRKGGLVGLSKHLANKFRSNGLQGIFNAASALETQVILVNSYAKWIKQFDLISESQRKNYKLIANAMENPPLISIVLPTYNSNQTWLKLAIESVRNQIYPNWELCIADDASTTTAVRKLLANYSSDKRIKILYREQNGHISHASNSGLSLATGEWIALLDHDDMLSENALLTVAQYIEKNPRAQMIYSDEDKIDIKGLRHGPYFKSDWNQDLFYSHNMFSHLGCYKFDLIKKVGGFRPGFEGAQDYDLALRCIEQISSDQIIHIPKILYHWRVHAKSTASFANAKPYAELAGEKALNAHFERRSINAQVKAVSHGYRVKYELPTNLPLVSIIIPTRNAVNLIRQCIDSVIAKTAYTHFEVIVVDNGSDDPATLDYLKSLSQSSRFKVISCAGEFNYSLLNNLAVAQCRGEYIALMNNDIEVISENWLSEMISIASQVGVGAVGAKLLYPDKSLQHGGVILGLGGVAGHSHKHLGYDQPSYFSRASLIQSFSAVTAACLVVSKFNYNAAGGLDDINLKVAFNDVDFCLRLGELGLRNVWTPYAELFHHESATRGSDEIDPAKQVRFAAESNYMYKRWGKLLTNDPAYNPNLTLEKEDFSLAFPPRTADFSNAL